MALFSQDLFEVFEEKSEPVSLTGKKRKRPEQKEDGGSADGHKKPKGTVSKGDSAAVPSTSGSSGPAEVVDLTVDEDTGGGGGEAVEEMV